MTHIRKLWKTLPRRIRIAVNLAAMLVLGFAVYIFCGCPAFTAEQRYRRAEKAHMVGPAKILITQDFTDNWAYETLIVADNGDGVIFYEFSQRPGTMESLFYREKSGDLTVLATPDMSSSIWPDDGSFTLPVFLFDRYPKAVRAELELTLSETVNNSYFEHTYHLKSVREGSGYFQFSLQTKSDQGAELFALRELSDMSGYDDSFNLHPQPVTVRLYNANDALIVEEEILVHCVAGYAQTEQGAVIPPKEHKKAAG